MKKKMLSVLAALALIISFVIPSEVFNTHAYAGENLISDSNDKPVVVIDKGGSVTGYDDISTALKKAKEGSTVRLQQNISVDRTAKTDTGQAGITLDLNGFNIDGTAAEGYADGVICMKTGYGWKPSAGTESKMSVINSRPGQGGEIKGELPLTIGTGDSTYKMACEIGEGVKLTTTDENANAVKLKNAYLLYSDTTKDLIKNGGFKITDEKGEERIYGSYTDARGSAAGGYVTLLNDYRGNEAIYSGDEDGTLDLGGNTYTYDSTGEAIEVNHPNVTLTIKNGKIILINEKCDGVSLVGAPYEDQMNNRGIVLEKVELTVPGEAYGIVTNGTETGNKVVLKDSVLNVKEGAGIYFPSTGEVKVENSVINAKLTGVQICAGTLEITGEKTAITVTGEPQPKTEGDGSVSDGAAVSIINRDGYEPVEEINIEAGTFTSADGVDALQAYSFSEGEASEWPAAKEHVGVSGGIYSSRVNMDYIDADAAFASYDSGDEESFAIGAGSIKALTSKAKAGDEITILKGNIALDIDIDGVVVSNTGGGDVTVNGKVVTDVPVETEKHIHKAVKTEATAPTSTKDGNIEYWYCQACGKYFADEALTKEISKADTVIAATGEGTGNDEKGDRPVPEAPKTGDDGGMISWIAVMALAAGMAVFLKRKEHQR